jgi:hypothetical protein
MSYSNTICNLRQAPELEIPLFMSYLSVGAFILDDLAVWKREIAELSGVRYAGVGVL